MEIANKRDYTKFFTYPETAKFMVDLLDPKDKDFILEPSAGNGALVKAVKEKCKDAIVVAIEIDERWRNDLSLITDISVIKDFLDIFENPKFSSCVANPPFGNGTDLQAHFDKIKRCVKKDGAIVLLLPEDFEIDFPHDCYPLENWSKNSDGTTTPIKIVKFINS